MVPYIFADVIVEFERDSYEVDEGAGEMEVCLIKTGEATRTISVDISVADNSSMETEGMLLL